MSVGLLRPRAVQCRRCGCPGCRSEAPTRLRRRTCRRRWDVASMLWLLLLALTWPGGNSTESNLSDQEGASSPEGQEGAGRVCDPVSEFTCTSEDRCIPIEWQCDFSEQCLDGQDEFGCLPELCEFGHDLCNLHNEAPVNTGSGARAIWRRYSAPITTERNQDIDDSDKQDNPALLTPTGAGSSLHEALLRLTSGDRTSQFVEDSSGKLERHYLLVPISASEKYQARAVLRSRPIGQTNSMCQLRLRYAMWMGSSLSNDGISAPIRQLMLARGASGLAQLRLTLIVSRAPEARAPQPPPPVVWSRVLNLRKGEPQIELDWSFGVVDLGHLTQVNLSLSAEIVRPAQAEQGKQRRLPIDHLGLEQPNQVQAFVLLDWMKFQGCAWPQGRPNGASLDLESALQAQSTRLPSPSPASHQARMPTKTNLPVVRATTYPTTATSTVALRTTIESLDAPEIAASGPQTGIKNRGTSQPRSCLASQFECSNGLCLDPKKVCNFVDDCMSGSLNTYPIPRSSGKAAATTSPNESQCYPSNLYNCPLEEDESAELCANVPGRRNFESGRLTQSGSCRTSQLADLDQACFWSLNDSHWPSWLISVRDSRAANQNPFSPLEHLPRTDHTLRRPEGHYLSLELPASRKPMGNDAYQLELSASSSSSANMSNKSMKNVYWAYLKSDWLRKREPGACRLKFFYNLVSSHQPDSSDKATKYHSTTSAAGPDQWRQPFRLYLITEHFKLDRDPTDSSRVVGLIRSTDSFTYTRPLPNGSWPRSRSNEPIQLTGVDFWREANHELEDLTEGDIFFVRLSVLVELNQLYKKPFRATLNIDDLSTHLGCVQAADRANSGGFSPLPVPEDPPRLQDYLLNWATFNTSSAGVDFHQEERKQTPSRLGKSYNKIKKQDFEPHKLIICVFGVLITILGFISVIVFIVVPYVEQITMNYHDQLAMGLSQLSITAEYLSQSQRRSACLQSERSSSSPVSQTITFPSNNLSSVNSSSTLETSDWEQLSRIAWRLPSAFDQIDSRPRSRAASQSNEPACSENPQAEDLRQVAHTASSSDSALPASDEEV